VEGFPETGRPLDPEPGLGGTFKCRPVWLESKQFFSGDQFFGRRDRCHRCPPKPAPRIAMRGSAL